ncbi:hypothetical protein [Nocardia sp. CNY236]|uniref:hypothetical protein n=1 Tax=Nocardia sp. CNY236 TaxID=1169152 RepID=UPI00041EAA66|nr:hypothetical protein [Nocardia sp. CNY236]
MSITTCIRHAELGDLVGLLNSQQAAKLDVVAPASALRARDGLLQLSGIDPVLDERGFTLVEGWYRPTAAADAHLGSKLKIPVPYLKWLRGQSRTDLYDANINGLLHGSHDPRLPGRGDDRSFLLRLFTSGGPDEPGVLRAVLSDRYGIIDNLDVLTAVLEGIRQADADVSVRSCDLTEASMHCKVYSPKAAHWHRASSTTTDPRSPPPNSRPNAAAPQANWRGGARSRPAKAAPISRAPSRSCSLGSGSPTPKSATTRSP